MSPGPGGAALSAGALSIIVPTWQEADHIDRVLRALQPLRAQGVQVLVVDGGSDDGTAPRAAAGADQVLQSGRGRAVQMNVGARCAAGAVLLFLHADTQLPANALEGILRAVDAGAQWGRFDVRIEGRPWMLHVVAHLMNLRSRWSGIATGDQALFITRSAFDRVGGFPEQPLMEDVEISRRLCRLGRPACLRDRVTTSGRRWERHGVWRTIWLMWRLRWRYWRGESPHTLARLYR